MCLLLGACAQPNARFKTQLSGTHSADSDQRLADAALANGNLEMALSLYKTILLRTPDDPAAQLGLANTLFQSNELQQARQVYLQLETHQPQVINAKIGLARISVQQQQLDDAAQRYQAILKQYPDNLVALAGLGVVYDLQQQHQQAQATYRQALLLHPDDLGLRNNLGLSLVLSHQVRAGITELLKIVDVPSAPPQARQNLALAYGLLGNDRAAERVLQADLSQPQIQNNLQYYRTLRAHLLLPGDTTVKKRRRRR